MSLNIFLDTNIYLSFYHFSSDDLEELKKLTVLLREKKATLFLTQQVLDEFSRNREIKIQDALKQFNESKMVDSFPNITKEYPEYETLRQIKRDFETTKQTLLDKMYNNISKHTLKADVIIRELFTLAHYKDKTRELIEAAKTRFDLGNPPGKNNSYGDALNWITLLEIVPISEDIYFIADDKDYFSQLNKDNFNSYLNDEWVEIKKSNLFFYKRLSDFFKDKFPQIKLAIELQKELLISKLMASGTFAETRRLLMKLQGLSNFTQTQLNDIVLASITNNQIYWLNKIPSVVQQLDKIIEGNEQLLDPENYQQYIAIYKKIEDKPIVELS